MTRRVKHIFRDLQASLYRNNARINRAILAHDWAKLKEVSIDLGEDARMLAQTADMMEATEGNLEPKKWRVGDWQMFVEARTEYGAQQVAESFVGIPGMTVPRVSPATPEELAYHEKVYGKLASLQR